jgi:hypothetical protein
MKFGTVIKNVLLYLCLKFEQNQTIWWILIELIRFVFHFHNLIKFNLSRCNLNLEMKIGRMIQHILLHL